MATRGGVYVGVKCEASLRHTSLQVDIYPHTSSCCRGSATGCGKMRLAAPVPVEPLSDVKNGHIINQSISSLTLTSISAAQFMASTADC